MENKLNLSIHKAINFAAKAHEIELLGTKVPRFLFRRSLLSVKLSLTTPLQLINKLL